jgi:hypothetical protein
MTLTALDWNSQLLGKATLLCEMLYEKEGAADEDRLVTGG